MKGNSEKGNVSREGSHEIDNCISKRSKCMFCESKGKFAHLCLVMSCEETGLKGTSTLLKYSVSRGLQ